MICMTSVAEEHANYGHYLLNVLVIHAGWQQFLLGQQQDHHSGPPLLILWLSCLPEDAPWFPGLSKRPRSPWPTSAQSQSMGCGQCHQKKRGWGPGRARCHGQNLGQRPIFGNGHQSLHREWHFCIPIIEIRMSDQGPHIPWYPMGFYDHRSSASGEAKIDFECEPWPSFPQARDLCQQLLAFQPEAGTTTEGGCRDGWEARNRSLMRGVDVLDVPVFIGSWVAICWMSSSGSKPFRSCSFKSSLAEREVTVEICWYFAWICVVDLDDFMIQADFSPN